MAFTDEFSCATRSSRENEMDRSREQIVGSGVGASVLLRQPYGFERLVPRVEGAPPNALPAPPPGYVPDRLLGRCVATSAAAALAQERERHVSKVVRLDNLGGEAGKDTEQVFQPPADSVVAVIVIAALQRSRAWDDLHIIVRECHKGVEVAPVEGVNGSADKVHVLLRHRPRSIPQAQESA
jgi:hypothetical protein